MKKNTKTVYWVQQDGHWDWFDVSETFERLSSAEAALKRYEEDLPNKRFRIAEETLCVTK